MATAYRDCIDATTGIMRQPHKKRRPFKKGRFPGNPKNPLPPGPKARRQWCASGTGALARGFDLAPVDRVAGR